MEFLHTTHRKAMDNLNDFLDGPVNADIEQQYENMRATTPWKRWGINLAESDWILIFVKLRDKLVHVVRVTGMKSSQLSCTLATEESVHWPAQLTKTLVSMGYADETILNIMMDPKYIHKRGMGEAKEFRSPDEIGQAHLLSLPRYTCNTTCEIGHPHYGDCFSLTRIRQARN